MHVTNPSLVDALVKAAETNPFVGVFLTHGEKEETSLSNSKPEDAELLLSTDGVHQVGTLASIARVVPFGPGQGVHLLLYGKRRVQVEHVVETEPVLRVKVKMLKDTGLEEPPPSVKEQSAAGGPGAGPEASEPRPKRARAKRGTLRRGAGGSEESANHIKAYTLEIVSTIKEIVKLNPLFKEQMQIFLDRVDMTNPSSLADMGAAVTTGDGVALQKVLEELHVPTRLQLTLDLLKKELELSRVQSKISKQAEEKLNNDQRNYILRQQLRQIKKELGMEKDDKEMLINKFDERLADKTVPEEASRVIEEEKLKLQSLENTSPEFNTTRNYLDWLTALPWGIYKEENLDIARAESVLDDMHFGMEDIKERIKEFIAVGNLCGSTQGKILCFVGPPGVGKTSIGKSIAKALDREFYRFSVGGLRDVAEIKGHRRTYVGAMPGKLIQCLKATATANPVVMIDEIDKLGSGYAGDPASALLEVLDPSQNSAFMDHYLDVPVRGAHLACGPQCPSSCARDSPQVDLSKMLFLCTANMTDTIPGPLLDRMEVVRLSGYITDEKLEILRKYLYPTALESTGLKPEHMVRSRLPGGRSMAAVDAARLTPSLSARAQELTDEAAVDLIRWYCREAGVRNLQKQTEKICRKVALRVVRGDTNLPITIDSSNLEDFVGKPQWTADRIYGTHTPPGVVMGLAWTSMGGTVLYVETVCTGIEERPAGPEGPPGPRKGSLTTTGKLGEVMVESSRIAHTLARRIVLGLDPSNDYLERASLHMHVPEGATPKDGPSAGCTMVTSLISLALNRPVRPDLAMTGEVSLTGIVLPIGGVKEKTVAAQRAGVKHMVLPETNRRDFLELPEKLREGLTVHYASTYDDVYDVAFGYAEEEAVPEEEAC